MDPLTDVIVARFANSIIEPLLNRDHVDSIQITMAEAFVFADPPDGSGTNSWLDAKARLISALRPLTAADTVRGQYRGLPGGRGRRPTSTVETYVAIRLALESWRWAGVPLLIRAGKALPVTATEVSIRFKPVPHDVFGLDASRFANTLRFRIWPEAATGITLAGKKPGAGRQAELHELSFAQHPGSDMRPSDRLDRRCAAGQPGALRPSGHRGSRMARVADPGLDDAAAACTATPRWARGVTEEADASAPERRYLARPGPHLTGRRGGAWAGWHLAVACRVPVHSTSVIGGRGGQPSEQLILGACRPTSNAPRSPGREWCSPRRSR